MTAAFDSTFLTMMLWDRAPPPNDPQTDRPVEYCRERVEHLVDTLHRSKRQIIIPTPVVSEVLVVSGPDGLRYLEVLEKAKVFRIAPFDTLAAIELAEMNRKVIAAGDKKAGELDPWQRIKLDRQIAAIAKVAGARTLYTDDGRLTRFARSVGLNVVGVHELPLAASAAQGDLVKFLEQQIASDDEEEPQVEELDAEAEDPEDR